MHDYALPFTLLVVADLLGVPEDDRDELRSRLTHKEPQSTQKMEHKPLEFLYEQFTDYIEDRRREPRDDVMTGLATATFPDGTLPPVHDVMRIAANLFSAGGETTARLMSTSFRILGDRPDLQAALRAEPEQIPAFIEEALRLEPPIKGEFRLSKVAVTVGELELPPGTSVFVLNGAANRDPRQFDDPLEFRLDRVNGRQHIGFGHGIHSCAGAPLARAETRITIERFLALTSRHPDLGSRARPRRRAALRVRPHLHAPRPARAAPRVHARPPEEPTTDDDLQPHRTGGDRPRALEALLPGRASASGSGTRSSRPTRRRRSSTASTPPLGVTASYLTLDGFVLELIHYSAPGATTPFTPRTMAEPGLTHLSISVDDVRATAAKAVEYGGEIVEDSDIGLALFIRDPDGQLLELLPGDASAPACRRSRDQPLARRRVVSLTRPNTLVSTRYTVQPIGHCVTILPVGAVK